MRFPVPPRRSYRPPAPRSQGRACEASLPVGLRPKTLLKGYEPYEPFKGLIAKTVALGYALISWHPFLDGNKRTAINVMRLTLNGVSMILPPYVVKYSIQIILPPETKLRIEEEEFLERISHLCHDSNKSAFWKTMHYRYYPRVLLRTYISVLERFPDSNFFSKRLGSKMFDRYAAKDSPTMEATIKQWQDRADQGYPRKVPVLQITELDFDEIPDEN